MYNLGFVLFTIGSALCGFSQNDSQLIIYRIVQGAGGALLLVNSLAIITEVFPPRLRGTAMGYNSIAFSTGSIIGPVLGGLILSATSWRWIFLINIPIGVIGTAVAYRYLREIPSSRSPEKLDLFGTFLFSSGLLCLLLALTQGIEIGWKSPMILSLLGVFVVALVSFLLWERRNESPALDLRLFDNRLFDFSVLAATFQSLAIFAVQFLVVFYLQAVRGLSPLQAALGLIPLPVMNAIVGPIGGRISDRVGARIPASIGLLIQIGALYWLSTITPTSPYEHIAIGLALMGTGGGLFYSPNTSAVMSAAPSDRLGIAAASLSTLRNSGMVISFALALAVAASSIPRDLMLQLFIGTTINLGARLKHAFTSGMHATFTASMGICFVAAILSLIRGREQRVRQRHYG